MLTEAYIEALLVDEELADQIWLAWYLGEADDESACIAWLLIAISQCDVGALLLQKVLTS